jgi:hypothetical protein
MSDIVPLFRCGSCGAPGAPVRLDLNGEQVATANACSSCVQRGVEFLAAERVLFDVIIGAGVDSACANAMMIARHIHMRQTRVP